MYPTGIGCRNVTVFSKHQSDFLFNSIRLSLHVHGMNQKFITMGRKLCNGLFVQHDIRIVLPAVGHNIITAISFAAAQIQNQMLFRNRLFHLLQPLIMKLPTLKYIGRHNNMTGARFQVLSCIFRSDSASDLEPSGIYLKSLHGLLL